MFKGIKKAIPQKVFFILFSILPLWFSLSYYPAYFKGLESYTYLQQSCVLLENQREKISPEEYRRKISYSYHYDGKEYVGNVYRYGMNLQSNNNRYVDKSFRKLKAGEATACFINPKNPAEAVIVQGTISPWYELVFFTLLVLAGIWGLYMSFFRPDWAEKNMIMDGDVT